MDAIEVRTVTKTFKLYKDRAFTLKERILGRKNKVETFTALHNVSLNIIKGQTVGLLGRNGSGKSTLLKLLTGILYPDQGEIQVKGKISSLLELGAGFQPEFTGRENVFMNAAILGLTKKEIKEKFNDILSFSELDDFIDNPVRTYSSGMYMRLAFSVAIMVEPDVLLIDEVLAVGDSAFQQKCMEQLIKLKTKGTTIVFVSHDLGAMKRLCDRVIWIHDSKIVSDGKPKDTIDKYLEFLGEEENKRLLGEKHSSQEEESSKIGLDSPLITDNKIKIMNVRLTNEIGEEKISFMSGDTACIKINYRAITKVNNPIFSLTISNLEGITCYSTSTLIDHLNIAEIVSDEIGSIQFYIPSLDLVANTYLISASILNESGYVYDVFEEGTALKVSSLSEDVGIVKLKHAWKLERG